MKRVWLVCGLLLAGCAAFEPPVVVYRHSPAPAAVGQGASPQQPLPLGQPPFQAVPPPPPLPNYPTVYPSAWDDPTLVFIYNTSVRAVVEVSIDGKAPIVLGPQEMSAVLKLDIGEHVARVRALVPTSFGPRATPERLIPILIEARGRYQVIPVSE